MPQRINKAVELLEQGQPVFYVGAHTGAELTYEAGKGLAKTTADYINVGMEHGSFDMAGLDAFMKGLVDGGPTNSGHHTPAVVVEAPVDGASREIIRANAWQFRQILARGVHGILLCHAETPDAVRAFVECCRYAFQTVGVGQGLDVGIRGRAGESSASPIWGLSMDEYMDRADPWPLNPSGELLLGVKIENVRALSNVGLTARVPGLGFAEWGPGDLAQSFGYKTAPRDPSPPELREARERVFAACNAAGIAFLDSMSADNAESKIDEGVRISGMHDEGAARIGREYAKRTMPV